MRKRWTPERDEELGASVGWDEVEEYMRIEKEVYSLASTFMVKNKMAGDKFYTERIDWVVKLIEKYGDLWEVWDAYERNEDIFAGLNEHVKSDLT